MGGGKGGKRETGEIQGEWKKVGRGWLGEWERARVGKGYLKSYRGK